MSIKGKTSRDKSIIDVLIFENGHILHHPPTKSQQWKVVRIEDYHS